MSGLGADARGAQVVWFKRDLRIADHAPLFEAARCSRCICLYVHEPEVMAADDFDSSDLVFINESLAELDAGLRRLGACLTLRAGRTRDVLDRLHEEVGIATLWSHQETGNAVTYARDRVVGAWAKHRGVPWVEVPGHGVVRRLASRDGWARPWQRQMRAPLVPVPPHVKSFPGLTPGERLDAAALGLPPSAREDVQPGGESHAHAHLASL